MFNYFIYDGEQVIRPEYLEERDPTEIALPYGADGATVPVQKFREVKRRAVDVIETVTNSGIKYDESEVTVDMCQAIQEIRKEERRLGEQDGELKKAQQDARSFYEMGIEIEKVARGVGYAVETVKGWLGIES